MSGPLDWKPVRGALAAYSDSTDTQYAIFDHRGRYFLSILNRHEGECGDFVSLEAAKLHAWHVEAWAAWPRPPDSPGRLGRGGRAPASPCRPPCGGRGFPA